MAADSKPLTVEAGADWDLVFTYQVKNPDGTPGLPINVTGYNMTLEVRLNGQVATDAPSFSVSTLTIGVVAPEIVVSHAPEGKFTMHVPASRTITLPPNTWAKALGFNATPNTHYTIRVFDPFGREKFALTGYLTVRPA